MCTQCESPFIHWMRTERNEKRKAQENHEKHFCKNLKETSYNY